MRCRSFAELPKLTTLCRSSVGLPKDRQPAEADNGLPQLRRSAEAAMRCRSFGGWSKLRWKNVGACGFESAGRAGDRREEQGGGELGDETSPLRRSRLQPADGEEREAEDRGRPVSADAGLRPVEPAAQESPPRGGEAEASPR